MAKKQVFKQVSSIKEAQLLVPKATTYLSNNPGEFFELTNDVVVYKGARYGGYTIFTSHLCFIKMLIPAGTKVYVTGYKCRAEKALVLEIKKSGRKDILTEAYSDCCPTFKYRPNQEVKPKHKFSLLHKECESGIHFFATLTAARNYMH